MRQDEYELALAAANAEMEARVMNTLDVLAGRPTFNTELGEAHLQIVRDTFETMFATDRSEEDE